MRFVIKLLIKRIFDRIRLVFLGSCLTLLFIQQAYAQHGYIPGFIIKQSGDSVHGFIKQQNSKKSALLCWFKNDESSEPRSFEPHEIQGYRFSESKYYGSKEYKIGEKSSSIFMEYLIKGKVNLYYFRDTSGDHYMIEKDGGEMIELSEPEKYVQKEGYGTIKAKPKYQGKLLSELKDCTGLQQAILESKLTNASLTQLVKQYHECVCPTENCVSYEKKKLKTTLRYSLVGGYTLTRYNFGHELITNFGSGFQAGILLNFSNILSSDAKLGFKTGLLFERDFSFTLSKFDKGNDDPTNVTYRGKPYAIGNEENELSVSELDVALNVNALKVPLMFNYSILRKKFLLEVGMGASSKFMFSNNSEFKYDPFNKEYGESIRSLFIGPAATVSSGIELTNNKMLMFHVSGEYLMDPRVNDSLVLTLTQFTFRVEYLF